MFASHNVLQVNAAAEVIYDLVDPSANLIFGAVIDQSLSGQVCFEPIRNSLPSNFSGLLIYILLSFFRGVNFQISLRIYLHGFALLI